jgi:hypothetical protein
MSLEPKSVEGVFTSILFFVGDRKLIFPITFFDFCKVQFLRALVFFSVSKEELICTLVFF